MYIAQLNELEFGSLVYSTICRFELISVEESTILNPHSKINRTHHTGDFTKKVPSATALFHIKGTWSVHSFNGDYLFIPEGSGSCGYLFHEIPGTCVH